jgi:hypothetical protein
MRNHGASPRCLWPFFFPGSHISAQDFAVHGGKEPKEKSDGGGCEVGFDMFGL